MRKITISLVGRKRRDITLWLSCLLILTIPALTQGAGPYEITWYTIDGGGGTSSGGPYVLTGTIGQPDADWSEGGKYELLGGFWPGGPVDCLPSMYSTYNDWLTLGKPDCWCTPYHCDGDADGATQGFQKYRVMSNDLGIVSANWKKLIDDATLDPCADIDHKPQGFQKYRVMSNDLGIVIANWKKTDSDLPGDCPRPE